MWLCVMVNCHSNVYDLHAVCVRNELLLASQESSHQYWSSSGVQNFGEFTVGEEQLKGFTIRTLSVLEGNVRTVHMYLDPYEDPPSDSVPYHQLDTRWKVLQFQTITDVIEEMAKVQRRTGNHPIVIHCK